MFKHSSLLIRPATASDVDEVHALARLSVDSLLPEFLTAEQMAETADFTSLDPWLISDGTYFVATMTGRIIGSGGWSGRRAIVGGPVSSNLDRMAVDPTFEPARIRAMYTHPDFVRRGIGRMLLSVSEAGARLAGFAKAEMIASLAGERLYRTCGWNLAERLKLNTRNGLELPACRMTKRFASNQ